MRILEVAALFTAMFVAYGQCEPGLLNSDVSLADKDYDYSESSHDDDHLIPESDSTIAKIYTRPQKFLVRLGTEVHLPCNISISKDFAVVWLRGTTQLYSDDLAFTSETQRILRRPDNTLIIKNFGENDVSDKYICQITTTPVKEIVHSVRTTKHLFVEPADKVEVNEPNRNITLACEANWEPKPKISWSSAGKVLPSDQFPEDGSSLTIYNVSVSNAGLYQCLVESEPRGNPIVRAINVLVPHPPQIEVDSEIMHTGMKMESELTCRVHAYPQATVRWFKDGKEIAGRKIATELDPAQFKHTLVISSTEQSAFGSYRCEASNSIGSESREILLTGVPSQAKLVAGATTPDGMTPILEWEVLSYSPITEYQLKYRRQGDKNWEIARPKAEDNGTTNTFKIKHIMDGISAGSWEAILLAHNEFGWSPAPREPYKFTGEYVSPEPENARSMPASSPSGGTESLGISRSLLPLVSLFVYACTHL